MGQKHGYSLIRSRKRRRTISLRIMPDGRAVIRAPIRTPQREIDSFFKAKSEWVQKKLLERERLQQKDGETPKRFIAGDKFLFLGEWYPLEIESMNGRKTPLSLLWSTFVLDEHRAGEAKELFVKWYKMEAKRLFAERVSHYSKKLLLSPNGVKITSAQFRYGSCSPDNSLCFSWRLIMAPLTIIDYIIIHELVHIKEKNHSKRFWSSVAAAMPDYRSHRLWLKKHAHLLIV